jgi:hypothetical protein
MPSDIVGIYAIKAAIPLCILFVSMNNNNVGALIT